MKHPIQPAAPDEYGIVRFKPNEIVNYLLYNGPFDLNHLATKKFSLEDQEQFAQLIGYSVSGFADLSYVSPDTLDAVDVMLANPEVGTASARIEALEAQLLELREGMRDSVARLYGLHPDDLCEP